MSINKKKGDAAILAVVALCVLILGGYALLKGTTSQPASQPVNQAASVQPSTDNSNQYGSVTGPAVYSEQFCINGLCENNKFIPKMNTASTTACSYKTGAATTTLAIATANFQAAATSSAAGPYRIEIGKSTVMDATTTLLARIDFQGGFAGVVNATNTLATLTDNVLAPNTWLNVNITGGGASSGVTTFSPVGICEFKVRPLIAQ